MSLHFVFLEEHLPAAWPKRLPAKAYRALAIRGDAALAEKLRGLFPDGAAPANSRVLLRAFKPGVSNPESQSLGRVLEIADSAIRADRLVTFEGELTADELQRLEWLWREPAIEELKVSNLADWRAAQERGTPAPARRDDSWDELPPERLGLEFEAPERASLDAEAARRGRPWNRAELELFAQTWSEHCKHKIFGARVRTADTVHATTEGLFGTHIRGPALEIVKKREGRYLSLFHDNAGVVALDTEAGAPTEWALALKMETHNSPSAIAPYGGASTGLVGVHRDILGTGIGARPVANWDVLCFEEPHHRESRPAAALPAEVVRKGVIKGIEDGGNQSGIPTVQGSVVFDPRYAVKPLVYAGCAGLLKKSHVDKKPQTGLKLYGVGGATGADGLRGAVMSSRDLRAEDFLGSAVQVASPFTQRCLTDFLLDARDRGLIDVVTDNGAGGFASSTGEMARLTGGAELDLTKLRLKFEGLHAWEKLLSESQERMTVATSQPAAFERLAAEWGVALDRLGVLNDSGRFVVKVDAKTLVDVDLEFLHEGCPRLELTSTWTNTDEVAALEKIESARPERRPDVFQDFVKMVGSSHLRSREEVSRAFDHEVQGRTLSKPFGGSTQRTPQDGSAVEVFEAGDATSFALGHGLAPQRSDIVENVLHSFDEALRQALLAGLRPETAGALDNFCWPDPIPRSGSDRQPERRLWKLVRACETISSLCRAFEIPCVSGKDSMKNNAGVYAVPETLVMTIAGSASSRTKRPPGFFFKPNDVVMALPPLEATLRDSAWERALGVRVAGASPRRVATPAAEVARNVEATARRLRDRYVRLRAALDAGEIRSAKDISEGGLLHAAFEMCIGRGWGLHFEEWVDDPLRWLGEGLGGFVFGVDPHRIRELQARFPELIRLGVVVAEPKLRWGVGRELAMSELEAAYTGEKDFWR